MHSFLPIASFLAVMTASMGATSIAAQPSSRDTAKTFFTRRDLVSVGAGVAGTAIVSRFDTRIAQWMERPALQGNASRHRAVSNLSSITGETTFTWAAVLGYGVGRVTHSTATADVTVHMIEAQVVMSVLGQSIRGVLGRSRPSVTPTDQYDFHWVKGFNHFEYRAFPSLHSAAGFVAASALVTEIDERNSRAAWIAAPILYAVALVPGVTRLYLDQHWASDVAAGAFAGTFLGNRIVRYAHTHRRTKLDRLLLGAIVVPDGRGGALAAISFQR